MALGASAVASVALTSGAARAATPSTPAVETLDVTPALIAAAKKEGSLMVRYSSPIDEMTVMARAFQQKFGITVQTDRRVGVMGTQLFATEERAGRHVMDVNYCADPAGMRDLAEEGLYLRYTLTDLANKLDAGTYIDGLGYCPKWTDVVLSYNPDQIPVATSRQMFKTWNGLLDPKLKGKIGINEPAGGGVPFSLFFNALPASAVRPQIRAAAGDAEPTPVSRLRAWARRPRGWRDFGVHPELGIDRDAHFPERRQDRLDLS